METKELTPVIYTLGLLLGIGLIGSMFLPASVKTMLSLAFATWFYFICPGHFLLLHLDMKPHERIIIGTAVSAAIVPLALYTLDIFGVALSRTTVVIVILAICGASYAKHRHVF